MKLIIDIPEEIYEPFMGGKYSEWVSDWLSRHEYSLIRNGTPMPNNATNGDVIKAMFGVKEVDMSNTYCVHFPEEEDYSHYFFKEWWNAPYQKGGKE